MTTFQDMFTMFTTVFVLGFSILVMMVTAYVLWWLLRKLQYLFRNNQIITTPSVDMMQKMKNLLYVENPGERDRWQEYLDWVDNSSGSDWWKLKRNGATEPEAAYDVGMLHKLRQRFQKA